MFEKYFLFFNQKDKKNPPKKNKQKKKTMFTLTSILLFIIYRAAEGWSLSHLALISSTVTIKYPFVTI